MNLDRVENRTHVRRRFPRYHASLFRGQALWDPYTHVILPPAALVSRQQQQQHGWKEKERLEKERKAAQNVEKKNPDCFKAMRCAHVHVPLFQPLPLRILRPHPSLSQPITREGTPRPGEPS